MHLHVLVLGDQLTRQVGPLADADPSQTSVLMIESSELGHSMRHHKQKLIHCFSAMRHFAAGLERDGFTVAYKKVEASFESGVEKYLNQYGNVTLNVMQPNDYGYDILLKEACEKYGGKLELHPNDLWLTSPETFDDWAIDRKTWQMEYFYRKVRAEYGWLMNGDEPEQGRWNFDKENRETPDEGRSFPDLLTFEPDEITQEVIDFVEKEFPDHFGEATPFGWAVTREQALDALTDFCENRLRNFGTL